MSVILEGRDDYLKNPYFKKHEYSDFSPFYIAIAICTVFAALCFIFNIVCCSCSKYSSYWKDRHTGNRWLVSLWTTTPHKQPSLDYTELEKGTTVTIVQRPPTKPSQEFELHKRESDI